MTNHDRSATPSNLARAQMMALAEKRLPPPSWHFDKIEQEMASPTPKDRMMHVVTRMGQQNAPDFSSIDWDAELAHFGDIDYPTYYQQPFHSVPGGYLSEAAAVGDRNAMEAIYEEAHPRKSLGMRDEIASLVPATSKSVIDLGGGTADAGAALARCLPEAQVVSMDASPFMLIVGAHQNPGLANLDLVQGFAENTRLEFGSVDAVVITLVFHECPDTIKRKILTEARRILRPGGRLILSDTPNDDLHDYRGFYEPYKEQWLVFDPETFLTEAGFQSIESHTVALPLWTVTAENPS